MRAAADRVDAQLREHMAAHAVGTATQERILVCVSESPAAREAIRVAKRSADRARADWIAVNVVSSQMERLAEADKDRLAGNLRLAERLGAEYPHEADRDIGAAILAYARDRNARRIVIGRPRSLWARWTAEDVAASLIARGRTVSR